MKADELRDLTAEELGQKERDLKRKLFNLRFQKTTAELSNSAELDKTRREIARVMTVAREKAREARG
jgi:large subunit ribosomal protein L29